MNLSVAPAAAFRCAVCAWVWLLVGCGDGRSAFVEDAPTPAPTATITLTGVAATGAPIDGAGVEATDADGDSIELTGNASGSDGRYTVELPEDVNFPILLRVSLPDGSVLSSLVNATAGAPAEPIIAHINPITDAVTRELLGAALDDPAALSNGLSQLSTAEPAATGNRVTQELLGAAVTFERFSSDPDFRARTAEGPGTLADAVLDVLGMRASTEGRDIPDLLADLRSQSEPARLLQTPSFQVELLAERIRNGVEEPTALGAELRVFGALQENAGDNSDDTLEALIESVPRLVSQVREQSAGQTLGEFSADTAVAAAARILGRTLQAKSDLFASDPIALANLAGRTSLTDGIVDLLAETVLPLLRNLEQQDVNEDVRLATEALTARMADETASALSALDLNRPDSEVLQVVRRFLTDALDGIDVDTVETIASGTETLDEQLPATNDFRDVVARLRDIVKADPALQDTTIIALTLGRWNEDRWGDFVWN